MRCNCKLPHARKLPTAPVSLEFTRAELGRKEVAIEVIHVMRA